MRDGGLARRDDAGQGAARKLNQKIETLEGEKSLVEELAGLTGWLKEANLEDLSAKAVA